MEKRGVLTGALGGILGSLCCLGPTILILLGVGAFFGISGACYTQYRLPFLSLGFLFVALSSFIYFRKKKSGKCEITPKGKIKFVAISVSIMLVTYMIFIVFIIPKIQAAFLHSSCSA